MIEQAKALLRDHEGLKLQPYICTAGKPTIGYGHNLENGISKHIAEMILDEDVNISAQELHDNFPWFIEKPVSIQAALIDMNFNLGWPRFSRFTKMLAAIETGDYEKAATEALDSRWAKQVGKRSETIANLIRSAGQ